MNENVSSLAVKTALSYVRKDPEKNLPKLMDWADRLDKNGMYKGQRDACRAIINDTDSNWYKLIMSVMHEIDPGVRDKFLENFIANGALIGGQKIQENRDKYGCNIPWTMLMDPTSACNLHCKGCWAAEYGNKLNLSFDELDNIINQAKDLGTHVFLFSGGEPLVRKDDVIKLCEKHNDCIFSAFTNGTLIDEEFADNMLRVKNFIPALSIEGFKEATDARRGEGAFDAMVKALDIMHERKLLYGVSGCYTSENFDEISREDYMDFLIEKGVKFEWLFTYMPIGKDAIPSLMVSPEQRETMYRRIRQYRETKPIFTLDFWNDGEYVGGCIAGGKAYCHINANGDIEPCAFVHYADANIRENTLLEAYQGPLFKAYRDNQPWNENPLRPCPILDNPGSLTEATKDIDIESTDYEKRESVKEYSDKCVPAAEKWTPVADKIWVEVQEKREAKAKAKEEAEAEAKEA